MGEKLTDERRIELIALLLETQIANIGYPVGCGIAPHPETVKKVAEACFKVATAEPRLP